MPIECQDVSVGFDLLSNFFYSNFSNVCNSLLSQGCSVVAKVNSLLQITPLEMLSLSCEYALHFVVWKLFVFSMFSACLWLSTLTSRFLIFVFLIRLEAALVAITFSMKKRENLARQTSSKDSMTMNLEKSAASFSKFNLNRFLSFFC